jgi:hypothetical protein
MTELFGYVDEQYDALRAAYNALPAEKRALRPAPEKWSADEVIGHLTLVERRIGGLIAVKVAEARAGGVAAESDHSPILPTIDLAPVLERTTKVTAPAATDPRQMPELPTWTDYTEAHEQLKRAFLTGDGLALGQILLPHPLFGPLGMYHWLAFAGGHAARHAVQIQEIGQQLDPQ